MTTMNNMRTSESDRKGTPWKELMGWFGLAFVLVLNGFFLKLNAFRGFNFYDMGSFLDASWRVYRGQLPYIDFIYTTGPVHLYLNAFFFFLFGFGKTAILAHLIVVSSIVIVAVFFAIRKYLPLPLLWIVILLTATAFYWAISHPWYDQSAHLWGILAVALLLRNLPFQGRERSFRISICCGILAVFSFMAKTNIGLAYGIVFFTVLSVSDERIKALSGYVIGAFAGFVLMMILIRDPMRYIDQCFLSYGAGQGQAGRFIYFTYGPAWLIAYFWIPAAVVCANLAFQWEKSKEFIVLSIGLYLTALFSTLTGSILKYANIFLWGAEMAVAFVALYKLYGEQVSRWKGVMRRISIICLVGVSFWWIGISVKYGLELKVWAYSTVSPFGTYALKSKPLEGWMCDQKSGEAVDAIVKTFRTEIPEKDTLLVLSDMQILYPLLGKDSYRGIPFIFHQGVLPVPGKQLFEVRNRIMENPADWIVINAGESSLVTYLISYLNLRDYLMSHYQPVSVFGNYAILKRKGG